MVEAISNAIDQEEANGATVVDHSETTSEERLDFKTLRAEAQELWTKITAINPENAQTLLKKVEMIMGRKMKLSEITEDQVDLLNLIVIDMRDMLVEEA